MLFPIIKVRYNDTEHEHIVGADSHDSLYIDEETGGIHYLNLQCMEGTMKFDEQSTYEFIGKVNEWDPYVQIEFVTFDKLIELYKQEIAMSCKQEREIRDMLKEFIEKQRKENRLDEDEGEIHHTSGNYRY
jgi:hypothetical protein